MLSVRLGVRRQVLDAAYAVLVRALFAQLERVAGPDAKHGDRLRLENYALLEGQLRPLAAKVGGPVGGVLQGQGAGLPVLVRQTQRDLLCWVGGPAWAQM